MTGFPEPDAWWIMQVNAEGQTKNVIACRPRDTEREIWDGIRVGPQQAAERFGMDCAVDVTELDHHVIELAANLPAFYAHLGNHHDIDQKLRQWLHALRAQGRAGVNAPDRIVDVGQVIARQRLIKDSSEISTMRLAAGYSAAAHVRAMEFTRPGHREYEIEAELLHAFRSAGAQSVAYGSIVASGPHSCILHHRAGSRAIRDQELVLIDAGCELDGYASDITRTFPVSGRFSGAQRTLYDIVLEAQEAAIAATRPGMRFIDPHNAAVKVLAQGLIDCGLISGPLDAAIESGAYRRFYMHRTGHWLGMDVHDCGDYREPGEPATGSEKPWRILRPGMVLTEEPGLYVRAADDIPRHFHDIGIRIEDDALVTEAGCEILTGKVPKAASEIEALMRS
jgi:Xaa-Pro aminopeptidase